MRRESCPTAFYRHFATMEELGLALVDESFRTLRQMIRSARAEANAEHVIRRSVEILVHHVHEHRLHFRFIARERFGGVNALRQAIRGEIRLFSSELATDLARFPYLNAWSTEDLQMMAGLIVNAMVSTAEGILDTADRPPRGRGRDRPHGREAAPPDRARRAALAQRRQRAGDRVEAGDRSLSG